MPLVIIPPEIKTAVEPALQSPTAKTTRSSMLHPELTGEQQQTHGNESCRILSAMLSYEMCVSATAYRRNRLCRQNRLCRPCRPCHRRCTDPDRRIQRRLHRVNSRLQCPQQCKCTLDAGWSRLPTMHADEQDRWTVMVRHRVATCHCICAQYRARYNQECLWLTFNG